MFCVYKLENNRGEVYYGITKDPKVRWHGHRAINNNCSSSILWKDDGIVNDIEVLEWFDTEELAIEREKELIRNNNCVNVQGKRTRKEQYIAYHKVYDKKNKERKSAYMKEYREKNKAKLRAYMKEYREKNK